MTRAMSAVEKVNHDFVEKAMPLDGQPDEVVVREFDPKFMRRTTIKVRLLVFGPGLNSLSHSWTLLSCPS